jgi:hypothetical protein
LTGADVAPGHAAGFYSWITTLPFHMTQPTHSHRLPDDDDPNTKRDWIHADPPYGTGFPEQVKRFRDLLAELIARRILTERQGPKDSDSETNA